MYLYQGPGVGGVSLWVRLAAFHLAPWRATSRGVGRFTHDDRPKIEAYEECSFHHMYRWDTTSAHVLVLVPSSVSRELLGEGGASGRYAVNITHDSSCRRPGCRVNNTTYSRGNFSGPTRVVPGQNPAAKRDQ